MFKVTVDNMREIALGEFILNANSPHSRDHWERVYENARLLAEGKSNVDMEVLIAFSFLHDCQREDDGADIGHGHRAAGFIKTLNLDLTITQMALLETAISLHDQGLHVDEPTISVCWDADRLDLDRVGIIPHPDLMSTELGKFIASKMQKTIKVSNYG